MAKLHFKYKPHWHESALGKQLITAIEQQLQKCLPSIFGFYLVQLGKKEYTHWLHASPIQQKIVVDSNPVLITQPNATLIQSPLKTLPFASDSIDAVFMPCVLEAASSPIAILEEAWRILLPSGTLILVGFNPWSLWGLAHFFFKHTHEFPWQGEFFSTATLRKWLTLTNFSIESLDYFYFRPPISTHHGHEKLNYLEKMGPRCYYPFGGLYLITATKYVAPLSPIKPKWKLALADDTLMSPSSQH